MRRIIALLSLSTAAVSCILSVQNRVCSVAHIPKFDRIVYPRKQLKKLNFYIKKNSKKWIHFQQLTLFCCWDSPASQQMAHSHIYTFYHRNLRLTVVRVGEMNLKWLINKSSKNWNHIPLQILYKSIINCIETTEQNVGNGFR